MDEPLTNADFILYVFIGPIIAMFILQYLLPVCWLALKGLVSWIAK
jgi:hypothetical protein